MSPFSTSPLPSPAAFRRRTVLQSLLVGACVAILLLATAPSLPMVWDEGNAILRSEGIARWMGRWCDKDASRPWSEEAIAADWAYTTQREGHPALYGILVAAGQGFHGWGINPLVSARLGPTLLFAAAAAAMYLRLSLDFSVLAGLTATAALLAQPRLFAHAHFASIDGPLTACWILAWATFPRTYRLWAAIAWGVFLGLAFSSKATGWLAVGPPIVWTVLYRNRSGLATLCRGIPIAVLTFLVVNPPLWHQPLEGIYRFVMLNLNRAANPDLNISIQFLGQIYNLDHPLPWYNTLFWTGVVVPVGLLGLAAIGLGSAFLRWRQEPAAVAILLQWGWLIVVRSLPGVPVHDGIRLFLPAFAMLAALVGIGAHRTVDWLPNALAGWIAPKLVRQASLAFLAAVLLGSASSVCWYWPQLLSYYNLAIGGLRGAAALGMEPTYYWDSLDDETFQWLHAHTPEGEKVSFSGGARGSLELQHQWGILQRDYLPEAPGRFRWTVIQNRPGGWQLEDRLMFEGRRHAFEKRIRAGGWGPWRLDVPLLTVFDYTPAGTPPDGL